MRKIVIFKDDVIDGKRHRSLMRAIQPSESFEGFSKFGKPIDSKIKKYAKDLEPNSTGYYLA